MDGGASNSVRALEEGVLVEATIGVKSELKSTEGAILEVGEEGPLADICVIQMLVYICRLLEGSMVKEL
jgi:hypothetical protein